MNKKFHWFGAVALSAVCLVQAASVQAKEVVIHAGRLLDGTMGPVREHVSIVIQDERIIDIQPGFTTPAGAEVIDLSAETVLPGMIDMHSHLGTLIEAGMSEMHEDSAAATSHVIRNAYHDLSTGFTSLRDVGTYGVEFKPIMAAIDKGLLVGPRIWPSLEPLGPDGGHSDPWNYGAYDATAETRERALVHGPIDAVEKVREHIRRGAKIIKIMPSGGVSSINDNPHTLAMTYEEIKAVVDTAHAMGVKVAAHAHGLEAMEACIKAGCDSIEHGTYGTEAVFKEMKQKGVYLDPTLTVAAWKYEMGRTHPEFFDPHVLAKGMVSWPLAISAATKAHAAGVKIVLGTDESALGKGLPKAAGVKRLVEAGLSPQEAIVAATGTAAELMGSDEIGQIQKGRYADVIAVKGDPLRDVTILQSVDFVMKGGLVIKQNGAMAVEMH